MNWLDRIRWRHIAYGTAALILLALLTGCATGERGGYIADPDAAISVTETGVTGGSGVLVGGEIARCTVAVSGSLPDGLTVVYAGERCRVVKEP